MAVSQSDMGLRDLRTAPLPSLGADSRRLGSHSVGYLRMVHAGVGQAVAVCASTWRKVRASQGTVPGNAWEA